MRKNRVLRIAHAYGNRRDKLDEALRGPVDLIEADIWYQRGAVWVRHERRLGLLPVLIDRRENVINGLGPWAFPIGPWYLRLDVKPIRLEELLETARGKRGLLLDVKGRYGPREGRAFAETLATLLRRQEAQEQIIVCGQAWSLLHHLRAVAPHLPIRYSIGSAGQWEAFLALREPFPNICIDHQLLDRGKAQLLAGKGVDIYAWTVDDSQLAHQLLQWGVAGLISNNLDLLGSLTG